MQKTPDRAPREFHKQFLTVRNVQRGFLDLSNAERFEVTPAEFGRWRLHMDIGGRAIAVEALKRRLADESRGTHAFADLPGSVLEVLPVFGVECIA